MNKTQHILTFDRAAWNAPQIATIVGCRCEYVRAVWHRHIDGYKSKDYARSAALQRTGDHVLASSHRRHAYREARLRNMSVTDSKRIAMRAYQRILRSTGDRKAASKAWREASL